MKKTYTVIIYFHVFIIIFGCKNNENNLVYNVNNKKIELLLLNDNKYIRYDEIVPVKFLIKGTTLSELRIVGPGISVSAENDSILRGNILVKKEFIKGFPNSIKNDTFHIKIYIVNINDKIKNRGEILVPLKIGNDTD
jgi:hypothetical protein